MHELKKCKQNQSESGSMCMTSTLIGYKFEYLDKGSEGFTILTHDYYDNVD